MKNRTLIAGMVLAVLMLLNGILPDSMGIAHEVLRYSSSAQVREALGMEGLNAFMEESGIELDLFVGSSSSAIHRLMNGFSDIASTAERLHEGHRRYGYEEIPFAKAALVVITNFKCPVITITHLQLRAIFDGSIANWKELGGPDQPVIVVVPEKNTSAYKNFAHLALRRFDVKFDYMAYRSTDVAQLVHRIPWSISFISQGAHLADKEIKTLKIDNIAPQDPAYPFHQIFSLVIKGIPGASAQKLIDFVFSEKGQVIIRKNGLEPIPR